MNFASHLVCQRCALFGQNIYKCSENIHAGAVMCLHEGVGVFQKLHFMGVCGALADGQLKQTNSADYNRTTATEEEMYLHAFKNSSLLHGNKWSASSPSHLILSRNPTGQEVGWADESVWRRWNFHPVCPIQESNPDSNRKLRISINEI
jgi:hypothetical protein